MTKKKNSKGTIQGGYRAAIVDWDDAWSDGTGVYTKDDFKDEPPFRIQSSGIVAHEDKTGIFLAKQRFASNGNFRGILFIPKAMIRKVTLL